MPGQVKSLNRAGRHSECPTPSSCEENHAGFHAGEPFDDMRRYKHRAAAFEYHRFRILRFKAAGAFEQHDLLLRAMPTPWSCTARVQPDHRDRRAVTRIAMLQRTGHAPGESRRQSENLLSVGTASPRHASSR